MVYSGGHKDAIRGISGAIGLAGILFRPLAAAFSSNRAGRAINAVPGCSMSGSGEEGFTAGFAHAAAHTIPQPRRVLSGVDEKILAVRLILT